MSIEWAQATVRSAVPGGVLHGYFLEVSAERRSQSTTNRRSYTSSLVDQRKKILSTDRPTGRSPCTGAMAYVREGPARSDDRNGTGPSHLRKRVLVLGTCVTQRGAATEFRRCGMRCLVPPFNRVQSYRETALRPSLRAFQRGSAKAFRTFPFPVDAPTETLRLNPLSKSGIRG